MSSSSSKSSGAEGVVKIFLIFLNCLSLVDKQGWRSFSQIHFLLFVLEICLVLYQSCNTLAVFVWSFNRDTIVTSFWLIGRNFSGLYSSPPKEKSHLNRMTEDTLHSFPSYSYYFVTLCDTGVVNFSVFILHISYNFPRDPSTHREAIQLFFQIFRRYVCFCSCEIFSLHCP